MKKYLFLFVFTLNVCFLGAQTLDSLQFWAYDNLPTWTGLVTGIPQKPHVYTYDSHVFKGHADFLNRGLGKKITFADFKQQVMFPENRQYLPLFIHDLRKMPLTHNGHTYKWAVRLEDYQYQDSPEQLAQTLANVRKWIANDLPQCKENQGIIVLNAGGTGAFNPQSLGTILTKKGLDFTTTAALRKHAGSPKWQILNGKEVMGKWVTVKDENAATALSAYDIAYYRYLPENIPPVAGIITTEPQTPLSHVNLLAKNRGTFNMYIEDPGLLPLAAQWEGKWVHLFPKDNFIHTEIVSETQARAWILAHTPAPVQIPMPMATFESVIPLSQDFLQYQSPEFIGAKASNYAKIYHLLGDIYVKKGFALGFAPYQHVLKQGAGALIADFLQKQPSMDIVSQKIALQNIRTSIQKATLPIESQQSLQKMIATHFKDTRIRLRSSTNCEDLPQFNGAGLYLSKGFNTYLPFDSLQSKILAVYASLWTYEAFAERAYFGIAHTQSAMAILIHEAFPDEEANGVLLTVPMPQGRTHMVVNVQKGEEKIVDPTHGHIAESFRLEEKGNIAEVFTRSSIGKVFIDHPEMLPLLQTLHTQALAIQTLMLGAQNVYPSNYGVDIEFKIVRIAGKPQLFIKQARLLKIELPE